MKRKYSIDKSNYEKNGQMCFFGRDNLVFKSINLPNSQKLVNLNNHFKIKKLITNSNILLKVITLY